MKSFLSFPESPVGYILQLLPLAGVFLVLACVPKTKEVTKQIAPASYVVHPDWSKSANIYEVNIRQYTSEGTFAAFQEHLPRLKELGVDILWFMPVFPIGSLNRKASQTVLAEEISNTEEREKYLGSYYAIKDFMDINPEFGTKEEFTKLVAKIHEMGMHVILDIAVNHTAWDHAWIKSHPEYYTRIEKGTTPWNPEWMKQHPEYYKFLEELGMTYPIDPNETDWWDTADLNYENDSLRNEMIRIFKFWISDLNIDGYRCDVAEWVPTDFWDEIRLELDKIKPVFMLAEAENPEHHTNAFDMSYSWELHHIYNSIAKGEKNAIDIVKYFAKQDTLFPADAYRMNFITNHDENSWKGTEKTRLGDAVNTMAVLTFTLPGMPLLYSGQEVGMNKMLRFFEKDTITWNTNPELSIFYSKLNNLKKNNQALWNGTSGGYIQPVNIKNDTTTLAFVREQHGNKVLVIANLSANVSVIELKNEIIKGEYVEYFTGDSKELKKTATIELAPWQYLVYISI
jgi:1,4-alpha-glucan branching enzyme